MPSNITLPPTAKLAACLAVLERVLVRARLLGYAGETAGLSPRDAQELAQLADAVHNIPSLLQAWPSCDEDLLRGMLEDFDQAFPGSALLEVYDRVAASSG